MIRYAKAHACGNDFLVVEASQVAPEKQREEAIRLCARNSGVGADGVEYLEWTGERRGQIRLFNADGSIAEISGNGTRCVAAWMAYQKYAGAGETITLETDAGSRECRLVAAEGSHFEFVSAMGVPAIGKRLVRLADGAAIEGAVVSTGNPHFVIFVEDGDFRVHTRDWRVVGEEICHHTDFPDQTNVEFVRIVSPEEIEIRIFERGVGPTTSSGTGTCATAAATIFLRGGRSSLRVVAPGGAQRVDWAGEGQAMLLTGPAELISVGEAFGC
jgi:diaminopimelate epimerase